LESSIERTWRKATYYVGGVDNLNYQENHESRFTFEDVAQTVGHPHAPLIIGPGAGSARIVKVNSELIANANLESKKFASKTVKIDDKGHYLMSDYPTSEFGLMANLLISEGKPGKVLQVKVSHRTGSLNFVTCMRKALEEHVKDKSVGLAGVFEIKRGTVKSHVMPDFPGCDLLNQKQVDEWLRFFEMKAPLMCYSVFVNNDFKKLGLRLEHTHFVSDHGDGGHYHYDITPEEVEYEGYFVQCEAAYRVQSAVPSKDRTVFFS